MVRLEGGPVYDTYRSPIRPVPEAQGRLESPTPYWTGSLWCQPSGSNWNARSRRDEAAAGSIGPEAAFLRLNPRDSGSYLWHPWMLPPWRTRTIELPRIS